MTSPMPPSAGNVLSEKDALAELLAWAKDRPKWQQDALRRLVLNDALTEVDIDDLVGICLDPNAPSQPITSAHVAAEGASGEPIALLRIENPTGINALAIDQKLEFAKDGLTVIYGDNGSGKSGYVRVLKHACRTRDRGTKILRDVEDTGATPQTAKIVFAQGVTEVDFTWTGLAAAARGQEHRDEAERMKEAAPEDFRRHQARPSSRSSQPRRASSPCGASARPRTPR